MLTENNCNGSCLKINTCTCDAELPEQKETSASKTIACTIIVIIEYLIPITLLTYFAYEYLFAA